MPRPPPSLPDALRDGGLPANFDLQQLQWLMAKHIRLSDKGIPAAHAHWRLRWAFTCHDLVQTIITKPR